MENEKAMQYLQGMVNDFKEKKSSFLIGAVHGACQALCMAGIITSAQWQQIEDQII